MDSHLCARLGNFMTIKWHEMLTRTLNMKITATILFVILSTRISFTQDKPEINVVYGDKYLFTIETPKNWVNDRDLANKIGLVCFFYEKDETNKNLNYFYANGIDKKFQQDKLNDFIKSDVEVYNKKYPKMTYSVVPIGFTGGVRNGTLYSFSNLSDRYKEEVLYSETDDAYIIISFSASTKEKYEKNQPIFDKFIESFNYRGNNPKPFLDYMNKNK
jgi:hypothetical protein